MVTNSRLVDQSGEGQITNPESPSSRETFCDSEDQSKTQLGKKVRHGA